MSEENKELPSTEEAQEAIVVDTEKANELINHLNAMNNEDVLFAFENINYDGLVNLNHLIAIAMVKIIRQAKEMAEESKHANH